MSALHGVALLPVLLGSSAVLAEGYPDMVGRWSGQVKVVQAGTGEVARGGMEIREVELNVDIVAQEGESFMGRTRNSAMGRDQPSNRVWGTIRSTGTEAIFATSAGARGHLWFQGDSQFEFCITNVQEALVTAYCAELQKQQ